MKMKKSEVPEKWPKHIPKPTNEEMKKIIEVGRLGKDLTQEEFFSVGISVLQQILLDKGITTNEETRTYFIRFAKEHLLRKKSGKT